MQSVQKAILDKIENIVDSFQRKRTPDIGEKELPVISVLQAQSYANTGILYFCKNFTTMFELCYDFQSSYATFKLRGRDLPTTDYYIRFSELAEVEVIYERIQTLLEVRSK